MPADLDDLFQALGRQADAVRLAGPDHARRRGRQRGRLRAGVSVAAAVVLLIAGVGVLRQPQERAAPPADRRGPAVPEVGAPVDAGGVLSYGITTRDDERAYAASARSQDNTAWLIAADLNTGAAAWPARPIVDPRRAIERVVAVPGAVLVVTRAHDGSAPALGLHAFDPATGAPRWRKEAEDADSLVVSNLALIRLASADGRIEAFDWVSGAPRWSVPPGGDRPARALGITRPADEERISRSGPAPFVTDSRFVVVTTSGTVEVRDVVTGRRHRTATVPADSGETMVAYGRWLFSHDEPDHADGPQPIRATDLTGDRGSAIVAEVPGGFVTLGGCGADRVCVLTEREGDRAAGRQTLVTAIDAGRGRQAWQATSQTGADGLSSARGQTLVTAVEGGYELFDASGHRLFSSVLDGGWLDAGTLLVHAPDGTGRLSRWTVADRRLHPVGRGPSRTVGECTSTPDRLACVTPAGLQIWDVG